jgi:hypothetical protein
MNARMSLSVPNRLSKRPLAREDYLVRAAEAAWQAERLSDPETKRLMQNVARTYLDLAGRRRGRIGTKSSH